MANVVEVLVRADDKASATLGRVQQNMRRFAAVGAVAVAGLGVATVKMASDFETSFTEVTTLFDAPQKQIDNLRQGVLDLSSTMGLDAVETTKALYQAISAGVEPAKALQFLEESAKLAVGGVTDMATAVDLNTTVLNAWGMAAEDVTRVNDVMFTTVRLGKTTVNELGSAMFNVAPVAAAMGVSVEEVGAALAALTAQGVPTTVATTQLRQAILSLSAPTTRQKKLMEELGLEITAEKLASEGLSAAFAEIIEAAEGDEAVLRKLIGSTEALQAVMALGGDQAQTFKDNLEAMGSASGATDEAFEKMNATFGRQFDILKSQLKVAMIEIGSKILPVVTEALQKLTPWLREKIPQAMAAVESAIEKVKPFIRAFITGLNTIRPVAEALFKFIIDNKPILVAAITAIGVAILLAFGPGAIAIAAIVGLIALIGVLRDHWREVVDKIKGAIDDFIAKMRELPVIGLVIDEIVGKIEEIKKTFEDIVSFVKNIFEGNWKTAWDDLKRIVANVIELALPEIVETGLRKMADIAAFALAAIGNIFAAPGAGFAKVKELVNDVIEDMKGLLSEHWKDILTVALAILFPPAAGIFWIVTHFEDVKKGVLGAMRAMGGALLAGWELLKTGVLNIARSMGETLLNGILFLGALLIAAFTSWPQRIIDALAGLPSMLFDLGKKAIQGFIDGLKSIPMPDLTPGFDIPGVPFLQRGTAFVPRDMLAVLHRGEMVIPARIARGIRQLEPDAQIAGPSAWTNYGYVQNVFPNVRDPRGVSRELDRQFRGL